MTKKIVTYAGTAIGTVEGIIKALGYKMVEVKSPEEVWDVKNVAAAILLGGSDINPGLYNQVRGTWTNLPDYRRDATEISILRYADFYSVPVLGICRGHQMMAAYYGGDLYQDIMDDLTGYFPPYYHKIKATPRLLNVIPTDTVNSLHHQAVHHVPQGFRVLARTYDDIIEAIWKPGRLGVQFHPEILFAAQPKWFNIFRWLVAGLD